MQKLFRFQTVGRLCALGVVAFTAAGHATVQAENVTRGTVAVTSTMGELAGYAVSHLIDKSGLSSTYVSGTTSFATYVASAAHDSSPSDNDWYSPAGATTGYLTFDLGTSYAINGLAVFALTGSPRVNSFVVYADNDSDPTNGNAGLLLDSGTFGPVGTGNPAVVPANVFSFSSVTTRYVTLQVTGHVSGNYAGIGEVVFSQAAAAVPEPSTYALMALGMTGVGVATRRRKA